MALSQKERDALPAEHFAVPGKRALPIPDEKHTRLAWDMVDRTHGLSDAERAEARKRILNRARELGIDTKSWTVHAVGWQLSAMSLEVPATPGHPNKMPFSGILTRIDEPSDRPPEGSAGHRIVIPQAVAEQALASLLGMAIDYRADLTGHDNQNKIGVITEARIEANAIHIAGFIYAKDFPQACISIKAQQAKLGMSYECDASVEDAQADPWIATHVIFTGAAVLQKHLAAYTSTSLAASADGVLSMTTDELNKAIGDAVGAAVKPLADKLTALQASGAVHDRVKPHAEALRSCAAAMEAAGIGTHPQHGHVNVLRRMADHMEAESILNRTPHIYRDHGYIDAGAAAGAGAGAQATQDPETKKSLDAIGESVKGLETIVKDLQAKAFNAAAGPERRTISPEVKQLLDKHGLAAAAAEGKLTLEQVDKALEGLPRQVAITQKLKLQGAGLLPAGA
ncbi:MAG: DUF6582 domain-containing protein [Steroidobacteraceae bacterium]